MEPTTLLIFSGAVFVISLMGIIFSYSRGKLSQKETGVVTKNAAPAKPGHTETKTPEFAKSIGIIYGTQTGTAETFSKELAEHLKRLFQARVTVKDIEDLDLDAVEVTLQKPDISFVICSTYGDGEPPDTCLPFFELLKSKVEEQQTDMLSEMKYGVFGLGNMQYEHYNCSGKTLDKLFAALGGQRLLDIGLGDDNEDIEADFAKWKDSLGDLIEVAGIPRLDGDRSGAARDEKPVDAFEVEILVGQDAIAFPEVNVPRSKGYDGHNPFKATLSVRRELHTTASDRSCLHVEVDLKASKLTYATGDHLGIFPENEEDLVKKLAARLNVDCTSIIAIKDPKAKAGNLKDAGAPNPIGHIGPLTVYTALARYCDLLTPLRKPAVAALAAFTADEKEKKRLLYLAGPDGKQEYADWMMKPYRSILEVLEEFPSCKPPLGAFLCSVAPRLQVRYYSISSSPKVSPSAPHCTVAVVEGETGTGRLHRGVASNWLGRLQAGKPMQVPAFVRTSTFRLPKDPAMPVVMVGPGTGLAPFRGFIQERLALKTEGVELGPAMLFFGCRSRTVDFIYQEELQEAEASGVLTVLDVAFSREKSQKVYVQHRIAERSKEVYELLKEKKGHFYICGDAKHMAKDVHRALLTLLKTEGGMTESQAETYTQEMTNSGRYCRDVW